MASLRQMASCMGLSGDISVLHDFCGLYARPSFFPVSILKQIQILRNLHIDINIIIVGIEYLKENEYVEISDAIEYARIIFSKVNLGIGRIKYYYISTMKSDGHEDIEDHEEAHDLIDEWRVPDDGLDRLDVFLVRYYGEVDGVDISGLSGDRPGPCTYTGSDDGIVVELQGNALLTGHTLAHELGHYLGLEKGDDPHHDDPNNLMYRYAAGQTKLTLQQGEIMRSRVSLCHEYLKMIETYEGAKLSTFAKLPC